MKGLRGKQPGWFALVGSLVSLFLGAVAVAEPAQSGAGTPGGRASLVSIIVKLEDDPVASYRGTIPGLAATSPQATGRKRVDRAANAVHRYRAYLGQKHVAFEAAVRAAIPQSRVTYRYDVVVGGVAMRVPENQVRQVARLPGVVAVYRDPLLRLLTDTSPPFIGAQTLWAHLGGAASAGEGVVIGMLDTGVWPEHPSFSDPDPRGKPYPAPPSAPTQCDFAGGANPGPSFTCNHKLIGAYRFMAAYDQCVADNACTSSGDFTSARDSEGHGTHTASTAAGNGRVDAQIFGIDRRDISGIAPRAHVVAYKICGADGCLGSDAVAAIQQAILDDVDVLNFSIGGGTNPYHDIVELAFRDAYAAGIFVAAAAGNEGPAADTVNHRGPWITTVAASTENRTFRSTLSLVGSNNTKLTMAGASITPGINTPRPVVNAASIGDEFCTAATPPGSLSAAVVVCKRGGGIGRLDKSFNVAQRGAAGMILYNDVEFDELETDNHSLPSVHIAKPDADALLAFLAAHAPVRATFDTGAVKHAEGDVMVRFSSRGGTTATIGISKPDITAPGLQILAGQTPQPAAAADPAGQLFQAIAGTSMSSPHIAGSAALLRHAHPDWTPGQIKSALMTTAFWKGLVKEDGVTPFDPFDAGSGRVDLANAPSPGLTFDVPVRDYIEHGGDLWTVNYPSMYIPDTAPNVLAVRRTPQSLLAQDSEWKIALVPDPSPGLTVAVAPSLTVRAGGSAPLDIHIDKSGIPAGEARHVTLQLTHKQFSVRMPISAAGPVARPDLIVTSVSAAAEGTRGAAFATSATIKNVGTAAATNFYFQVYLSRDDASLSADDVFYWFCDFGSLGPDVSTFCDATYPIPSSIPAGTYYLIVRVDDGETVAESNDDNNVASAGPITIK